MAGLKWLTAYVICMMYALEARARSWSVRLRTQSHSGQGLVEYALILVLVAIVVIGALSMLGTQTSSVYAQINCTLSGGQYHQDNGNGHSNRCR